MGCGPSKSPAQVHPASDQQLGTSGSGASGSAAGYVLSDELKLEAERIFKAADKKGTGTIEPKDFPNLRNQPEKVDSSTAQTYAPVDGWRSGHMDMAGWVAFITSQATKHATSGQGGDMLARQLLQAYNEGLQLDDHERRDSIRRRSSAPGLDTVAESEGAPAPNAPAVAPSPSKTLGMAPLPKVGRGRLRKSRLYENAVKGAPSQKDTSDAAKLDELMESFAEEEEEEEADEEGSGSGSFNKKWKPPENVRLSIPEAIVKEAEGAEATNNGAK